MFPIAPIPQKGLFRLPLSRRAKGYALDLVVRLGAVYFGSQTAADFDKRALAQAKAGDFAGAITDIDRAILLNPNIATEYHIRGVAKRAKGDNDGAFADDDHTIALDPNFVEAFAGRGFAKQSKGDFTGALADYDKVISLDQTELNEYVRFQHHLLIGRLGRADDDLGKQVEGWKESWPKTVGQFLSGKMDEMELLRRAGDTKDAKTASEQACEATYYAGMADLLAGHPDGAREKFLAGVATGVSHFTEFDLAKTELARRK